MTEADVIIKHSKILKGIELAYQRLLISKQKEDGELAISRDGKIVRVKASELLENTLINVSS